MLKSTHRPPQSVGAPPPLPPGWTAHIAPTGHPYYHNAATGQSTYTHPSVSTSSSHSHGAHSTYQGRVSPQDVTQHVVAPAPSFSLSSGRYGHAIPFLHHSTRRQGNSEHRRHGHFHSARRQNKKAEDRPKSKQVIPGHKPWLLVKTKFGRHFVHNLDTKESFWRIPELLKDAIALMAQHTATENDTLPTDHVRVSEKEELEAQETITENMDANEPGVAEKDEGDIHRESESDEYEEVEVEVTDDEDDDSPTKRQRLDQDSSGQPREFNEDDIAFQLAAMGQDYGLDPGEYGDGGEAEWEEGAEGLPLTEEESTGLFKQLLDDLNLNPFSTWEAIVQNGQIVEDERYTILPNMKSRKDVWADWSRRKIQALKEEREKEEKKDPLLQYRAFLQQHASPKLYWAEFRRKFRSAPEMRDVKVSDKLREKLYREHVSGMKKGKENIA